MVLQSPFFWIATGLILTFTFNSPALALCVGSIIALIWGNPLKNITGKLSKYLLQLAVILLGFGLQLNVILKVGYTSLGITFFSISTTMLLGWLLGKLYKVEHNVSLLINSGTAICGGSAIAAMSPAIGASQAQTAVAMAVVFLLNGIALLIFPYAGHFMELSQTDFGIWAALAIHDTSSVVGASAIYGTEALVIGTTVKLTRALWILPLSFLGAKLNKNQSKATIPWFLFGFLLTALIRSLMPEADGCWNMLALGGKKLMVGTLFFVGAGLTKEDLKKIGKGALLKAVTLWVLVEGIVEERNLDEKEWVKDVLVVIASPEHPFACRSMVPMAEMIEEQWVLRERGSGTLSSFEALLASKNLRFPYVQEIGHTEAIKRVVEAGMGMSCLSRLAVEQELREGSLVEIPTDIEISRWFRIISLPEEHRSRLFNYMMKWLFSFASVK